MSLSDIKTLISWVFFLNELLMSFWIGVKGTIERIVYKLDHSVLQLSFHRSRWPVACDLQKNPADNHRVFQVFPCALEVNWAWFLRHLITLFSVICFELLITRIPITWTFLDLPSRFELSEVDCTDCTQSLTWLKYVQCWEVGCVRLHVA